METHPYSASTLRYPPRELSHTAHCSASSSSSCRQNRAHFIRIPRCWLLCGFIQRWRRGARRRLCRCRGRDQGAGIHRGMRWRAILGGACAAAAAAAAACSEYRLAHFLAVTLTRHYASIPLSSGGRPIHGAMQRPVVAVVVTVGLEICCCWGQ